MLGHVATLTIDSGPAEIDRYDRLRNVTFEIELNQQPLGQVDALARPLPSLQKLPPGVILTTVLRGDAASSWPRAAGVPRGPVAPYSLLLQVIAVDPPPQVDTCHAADAAQHKASENTEIRAEPPAHPSQNSHAYDDAKLVHVISWLKDAWD
jgi:hypothetical protein